MFDLLWLTNFIKTGTNLSVGTKFARIYNLGPRPSIRSNCLHNLHARFALSAKFHKNWGTVQFWGQISQMSDFRSRSSIPINILLISMFDLYWLPYFIKIRHIAILRPNLPKLLILGQDPQFQISYSWLTNLTCSECQISQHWEYFWFLGLNFLEWGDWYLF